MSDRPVWMSMYWSDYFGDTKHLTTIQHGAYLLLIGHYWLHGGLPDDDRALATIVGMRVDTWRRWHRETIRHFFEDGWRHGRIEDELEKARKFSEKQRDNANERWQKTDANAYARARATPQPQPQEKETPEPVASPSSTRSTEPVAHSCGRAATRTRVREAFEMFWKVHARRDGADPKKPAEKLFERAVNSGTDPDVIIEAAEAYAAELGKKGELGTRFVPQARTWLAEQRWTDHAPKPPQAGPPQGAPSNDQLQRKYGRQRHASEARDVLRSGNGNDPADRGAGLRAGSGR